MNWVRSRSWVGYTVIARVPYILQKNSAFHSKTKHIQLKYHFIWLALEDGQLKLEKIHTNQNPADMLTKVLTREKLRIYSVAIGLQV